jgi:hypothetical protein
MLPSLFVLIPGFGKPNESVKTQVLSHNIRKICSYNWASLKIRVCIYDDTELPKNIIDIPCVDVQRSKGLPGTFIKEYAHPDEVTVAYDLILILYDDILLMPDVDMEKMIELKDFFHLDIVSPTLTLDSQYVYKYMLTEPESNYDMKISPCCEIFCFLFDKTSYRKYYEHVDAKMNPWLWGLDLILYKQFGLRVGLINTMTMKHLFANTSYQSNQEHDPKIGYFQTMAKYGIDHTILKDQPVAFFYIKQSSCIDP